jgi:hypothetical protein
MPRKRRPGLDDKRYLANRQILRRTGSHICAWCKFPIDLQVRYPHPLSWSCDHRIPRSTLAPDDPRQWHLDFLLESHFRCNSSRGAKPLNTTPLEQFDTNIDW